MMDEYRERKILKLELKKITPESATKMLEANKSNRNLSWKIVQGYANDMKRGAWRLTHQGIAVNAAGEIMDGQHRLWAVIESGCTIQCFIAVYEGNESALMWPFDKGRNRTTTDTTGIPIREVAVVKMMVRALYGQTRLPDDLVIRLHEKLKQHIDSVEDPHVRALSIAPVRAAVILRHACGVDWTNQFYIIAHRRYQEMGGMTAALYQKLMESAGAHGGMPSNVKFAQTWHASDLTRKNQKVFRATYLKDATDEALANFKRLAPEIAAEIERLSRASKHAPAKIAKEKK